MYKKLPTSNILSVNTSKGFTLIELLVVIAIIAVLSVIAFIIYNGIQPRARNDRRRADLDSIAKALEVNKTSTGYVALANGQFANGAIPTTDPQTYPYCGNTTASAQPGTPGVWTTVCPANFSTIGTGIPLPGTAWKICTSLEAEGATAAVALCRGSAQ